MAKYDAASIEEQGLTKKQLKRLQRKRKKILAEAADRPESKEDVVAAAAPSKIPVQRESNVGDDTVMVSPNAATAIDENYIRNSLVGKLAEALLRKQLEEEAGRGGPRKRAKLESGPSDPEAPPRTKVPFANEALNPKKKKDRKKRKKGQAPGIDIGARDKQEGKGIISVEEKQRHNAEPDAQKWKQPKADQVSPWPEIKYEASSAQVVLRLGQSLMVDGMANVTLISGNASILGYKLKPEEEVLVTSSGQFAPVPVVVFDRPQGKIQPEGLDENGDMTSNGSEPVVLFRSYSSKKKSDGEETAAGQKGRQRTFRLEARASGSALRSLPRKPAETAEPSPGKGKGLDIKLQPTVVPFAWKTVTDSVLEADCTRTSGASDGVDRAQSRPEGRGGAGFSSPEGAAEAGSSGRPPIVAVCGGKNVGKSTYGRYLMNQLLNRYSAVAYLETDVGQPEFTVPGMLSLHLLTAPVFGPPNMHLRDPERAYFYGDVSAKTDPELYLRCVVALYDHFRRRHYDVTAKDEQIPLVINTHGWIKGLGLDVLVDILRYTVPTHVVDVQSSKANKNLPPGNFWETTMEPLSRVHYIPTAVASEPDASTPFAHKFAPEERALRLLAHFSKATTSGTPPAYPFSEKDAYTSLATSLAHHPPYQVRLNAVRLRQLHAHIPQEEALWAMNGAVVGLAQGSEEGETGPMPCCLGVGLVRGIDPARGVLFLITCLSSAQLQKVNMLIQGKVDLPLQLMSATPYVSPYLSLNSIAAEGTGSATIKSRNNIVRKVGE